MTPLSRYWRRRLGRHALLAAASAGALTTVALLLREGSAVFRLSMGTAYASLALITASLLIGPWNVLRRRPNPVSSDLRRDVGIWGALLGVAHVIFGLQVHLPGRMLQYFLWARDERRLIPARYDLAGATNWSGLAAALVLVVLLAISNDAALRRLGTARWKRVQRWNYAGFALIAVHGAIYQVLERRTVPWIVLFAAMLVVVTLTQVAGLRRARARPAASAPGEAAPPDGRPRPTRPGFPPA